VKIQFPKGQVVEYKDIDDSLFGKIFMECYSNCMCVDFKWIEPIYSLYLDIKYIVKHNIPGDIGKLHCYT